MLFLFISGISLVSMANIAAASGGGSVDRCIRFWNINSGECLNSVDTKSQVGTYKAHFGYSWYRNDDTVTVILEKPIV